MKIDKFIAIVCFLVCSFSAHAQVFDVVVAKDGSGNYTSLTSALQRSRNIKLIYVKNGVYQEKGAHNKDGVNIIGESREGVIIEWDDYSGDSDGHSTATSYTYQFGADDIYVENLTIKNTAGNVGQAVAIHTLGDRQIFNNCSFTGFQDTYYANSGIQYNYNCSIDGATDFIFGDATAVFENCVINCLSGGQYITAPADTKLFTTVGDSLFYHGLLFKSCEVLPGDGVSDGSYYLGRPWQGDASSVYLNCNMGSHIRDIGWSTWNDNNHLSGLYAEYNTMNLSGNPVDVSQRADWSVQLTEEQANTYYTLDYFLNGWDPVPAVQSLETPENLAQDLTSAFFEMTWDEVTGAIGYEISKNGSTIGFSETATFTDSAAFNGDQYRVRSVKSNGNLSDYSTTLEAIGLVVAHTPENVDLDFRIIDNQLIISEPVRMRLLSLSGKTLISEENSSQITLEGLKPGVYILQMITDSKKYVSQKVFLK